MPPVMDPSVSHVLTEDCTSPPRVAPCPPLEPPCPYGFHHSESYVPTQGLAIPTQVQYPPPRTPCAHLEPPQDHPELSCAHPVLFHAHPQNPCAHMDPTRVLCAHPGLGNPPGPIPPTQDPLCPPGETTSLLRAILCPPSAVSCPPRTLSAHSDLLHNCSVPCMPMQGPLCPYEIPQAHPEPFCSHPDLPPGPIAPQSGPLYTHLSIPLPHPEPFCTRSVLIHPHPSPISLSRIP